MIILSPEWERNYFWRRFLKFMAYLDVKEFFFYLWKRDNVITNRLVCLEALRRKDQEALMASENGTIFFNKLASVFERYLILSIAEEMAVSYMCGVNSLIPSEILEPKTKKLASMIGSACYLIPLRDFKEHASIRDLREVTKVGQLLMWLMKTGLFTDKECQEILDNKPSKEWKDFKSLDLNHRQLVSTHSMSVFKPSEVLA